MLVSELTGADLALWVARAQGLDVRRQGVNSWIWIGGYPNGVATYITGDYVPRYAPHEDWTQGGPLIEKHTINVGANYAHGEREAWGRTEGGGHWWASIEFPVRGYVHGAGATPLIAAMRALVASVYGDTVPDEVTHDR